MKIIEECSGRGNNLKGCGAKLIVEYGDLSTTSKRNQMSEWIHIATFCCPLCGTPTDLNMDSEIVSKLGVINEL